MQARVAAHARNPITDPLLRASSEPIRRAGRPIEIQS